MINKQQQQELETELKELKTLIIETIELKNRAKVNKSTIFAEIYSCYIAIYLALSLPAHTHIHALNNTHTHIARHNGGLLQSFGSTAYSI